MTLGCDPRLLNSRAHMLKPDLGPGKSGSKSRFCRFGGYDPLWGPQGSSGLDASAVLGSCPHPPLSSGLWAGCLRVCSVLPQTLGGLPQVGQLLGWGRGSY